MRARFEGGFEEIQDGRGAAGAAPGSGRRAKGLSRRRSRTLSAESLSTSSSASRSGRISRRGSMSFREELGALGRTAERVARHRTTQVSGTCNECCKSLGDWAWSGWSRVLDVV